MYRKKPPTLIPALCKITLLLLYVYLSKMSNIILPYTPISHAFLKNSTEDAKKTY